MTIKEDSTGRNREGNKEKYLLLQPSISRFLRGSFESVGAKGEKTSIKTNNQENVEERASNPMTKHKVSLSFSILRVTPITIFLQVNVSSEAIVWCGAWPFGQFIDFHALQRNVSGQVISSSSFLSSSSIESSRYRITDLHPSSSYDVTCLALNKAGYMSENPLDIRQMVMTQDAEFAITEHLIMDNKVHIMLKSNYDTPVLCFLFNRRGMRVDTKMYNPSQDPYISFDIPSMKLSYRVQCSAMNERQKGRQELEEGGNNA